MKTYENVKKYGNCIHGRTGLDWGVLACVVGVGCGLDITHLP